MNSDRDTPCGVGCPIRRSRDHRSLASPPGFSQRATSFIASQCQGIHQMPLLALDPRRNICSAAQNRRAQGQNPSPALAGRRPSRNLSLRKQGAGAHAVRRPHMKTLLRTHPARLRRAHPPRSHDKLSLHPSNNTPARVAPDGVSLIFSKRRWCPDGGGERIRTDDLLLAKQALSQLSYTPLPEIRNRGQRSDL
jgi:hypothetical protein